MNKTKRIVLILSSVLSVFIIVGAFLIAQNREKPASAATAAEQRLVTKAELAKATGKDGHVCYVAVDGMVYQIKDFSLWQNGEHKTSGGLAYCGADMSEAINKSPHGHKVLDVLIQIGPLKA